MSSTLVDNRPETLSPLVSHSTGPGVSWLSYLSKVIVTCQHPNFLNPYTVLTASGVRKDVKAYVKLKAPSMLWPWKSANCRTTPPSWNETCKIRLGENWRDILLEISVMNDDRLIHKDECLAQVKMKVGDLIELQGKGSGTIFGVKLLDVH